MRRLPHQRRHRSGYEAHVVLQLHVVELDLLHFPKAVFPNPLRNIINARSYNFDTDLTATNCEQGLE